MKSTLKLLIALIATSYSFSQTQLIKHRSHSGSSSTFKFKKEGSHFGLGPDQWRAINPPKCIKPSEVSPKDTLKSKTDQQHVKPKRKSKKKLKH